MNETQLEENLLWSDHYYLTREVIKDYVYNTGCLNDDLDYLMENQDNIGNNFSQLTGNKKAGKELTALLKEHISIAVQIVQAASAGKDTSVLYKQWQDNAIHIAHVYHQYNKKLNEKKMREMMLMHLSTTLDEATAIINKNCKDANEKGEVALNHIHMMSQYISSKF